MNHMTDEQFAEWLAGETDAQTRAHLESCPQCRAEGFELRDGLSRYSVAMRREAARAQTEMPGDFAPRRAWAQQRRLRWAGAGVLALLLAAQTVWLLKPRPAPPVAHVSSQPAASSEPTTQSALLSATQSAAPSGDQLSDDELLEAVNNDLSREVPLALAPVGAITTARNQMLAASSGNASHK